MISPLKGYILVEPEAADEVSAGGIYLPTESEEKPSKGKVIAVSENAPVAIDDIIFFRKWTVDEVEDQGKKYKFVKFEDCLGVVKK